jgi:hypothetical protein
MKKAPAIPEELIPEVVAQTILREVAVATECQVLEQARLIEYLCGRARKFAEVNESFRKKLRSARGREWLYSFMRHWLAAELDRTHPVVFRRLQSRFAMGEPALPWRTQRAYLLETSG